MIKIEMRNKRIWTKVLKCPAVEVSLCGSTIIPTKYSEKMLNQIIRIFNGVFISISYNKHGMTLLPIPIYVFLSVLSRVIAIIFWYVEKSDDPHAKMHGKNFHAFSLKFLITRHAFISLVSWNFIPIMAFRPIKLAKTSSF